MKVIKSNDRVFIHGACAAPQKLIYAMTNRAKELRNVETVHIHLEADTPYVKPEYAESFHCTNLFTGASCRKAVQVRIQWIIVLFLKGRKSRFRACIS